MIVDSANLLRLLSWSLFLALCSCGNILGNKKHDVSKNHLPYKDGEIDTEAPSSPTIVSPSGASFQNNPMTVSGMCESEATVTITNTNLSTNPTEILCSGGTYSADVNWLAAADGNSETLTVTQTDTSNNESSAITVVVNVDLTAPNTPVSVLMDDWTTSDDTSPTFSFSDGGGGTDHFEIALGTSSGANDVVDWVDAVSGATFNVAPAVFPECTLLFASVRAVDAAGNISALETSQTFRSDRTAPSVPTSLSLSEIAYLNSSPNLSWTNGTDSCSSTTSEISAGLSAGATDVQSNIDIGTVTTYQLIDNVDSASIHLDFDTNYFLNVQTKDEAGNLSTASSSSVWLVETPTGLFEGSQVVAGTNLNQATASPFQWSSSDFNASYFSHSTSTNSHQVTVLKAGDYKLTLTLPVFSTGQRPVIVSSIRVNGVAIGRGLSESSYIRNQNGHQESSNHFDVLLTDLAVNDVIVVTMERGTSTTTAVTSPGGRLAIEYIHASREIFMGTATESVLGTNLNSSSESPLKWTQVKIDSEFTHNNGANPQNILLTSGGSYFISVNLPLERDGACADSNDRTSVQLKVKVNGSVVQGGVGSQAYMRCFSGHEHSSAHFVGMIHSVSPNSTLTIDVVGETDDFVAVKTQSSMFADMYIEKVDTNHGLASLSAVNPSSGTNWNASTSGLDLNWDQQSTIDSSFYTHSTTTNSHQITFAKSGDYLLFYNDHLDKTSSSRTNVRVRLLVNGSAETSAQCLTHYARDTQSHDESSCAMGVLLKGISAGDNVSFELLREANSGTVLAKSRALLTVIRR